MTGQKFHRRVAKLERAAGLIGSCPVCGGEGRGRIAMVLNGVEIPTRIPAGCPRCGKDRVWRQIIIDKPDITENERRTLHAISGGGPPG